MSTPFKITARKIMPQTLNKAALYEVEYAEGVIAIVYAASREEALAKVVRT